MSPAATRVVETDQRLAIGKIERFSPSIVGKKTPHLAVIWFDTRYVRSDPLLRFVFYVSSDHLILVAKRIFDLTDTLIQDWLDMTGQFFFENDFSSYLDQYLLPMIIATSGGVQFQIKDAKTLRDGFDAWVAMLHEQRVTLMVRRVVNSCREEDGDIVAIYSTNLLREAIRVVPPYESALRLREVEGRLRCVGVISGMSNMSWPITVPRVLPQGPALPDPCKAQTTGDAETSRDHLRALAAFSPPQTDHTGN